MPTPTLTRPAGAALTGIGLGLFDQAPATKVALIALPLILIALPLWAGQQDGGSIEVGEGAFDGLAAWLGRSIGAEIMKP